MKQIATALVKAQKEFGPALKTSTNPHLKNKYANLSSVIEAVIDALNNNGIFLMQMTHETPDGAMAETTFIHESGEIISAGKLFFPAAKHDAQGYASALTYVRRYSLMAACGIAPEDDDGHLATASPPKAAPKPEPKPETKPQVNPEPKPPANTEPKPEVKPVQRIPASDDVAFLMDHYKVFIEYCTTEDSLTKFWKDNIAAAKLIERKDPDSLAQLLAIFKARKDHIKGEQHEQAVS